MRLPSVLLVLLGACGGGPAARPAPPPVPPRPDLLLVANKQANTVSFLDPARGTELGVVEVGTGPHEIAVSPDGGLAVVTNYGSKDEPGRSLSVLDVAARRVARTIDLAEHRRPHGVAFLPGGKEVVVTVEDSQAVLVVDLADGRIARVLPTAQQGSHMVVLSSDGKRAFTANIGSGTVSALDVAGHGEARSAPVATHTEAIALVGRELWIGSNQENTVSIHDAETLAPLAKLPTGTTPIRVNGTPDGRTVLVTNVQSHMLQIFDAASRRELGRVEFGPESYPVGTLVAPDGRTAFVALIAKNRVAVVDLERRAVTATFATGLGPDGLGYAASKPAATVPPAAVFDAAYRAAHRGRIRVSVPEVYELVNVAIALTPLARAAGGLVVTDTPYFQDVERELGRLRDHPFVRALASDMERAPDRYFELKMNGYAFEFEGDRIVRSRVYDRTGFAESTANDLLPYLAQMQDFADQSRFRRFYAAHRTLYDQQIATLERELDLRAMLRWLRARFPAVPPYDTYNIVFSPLVGSNQSVTWFESHGFRELQPHVNFPYPRPADGLSPASIKLRRGYILFTELNHGFINPTTEPYAARIEAALRDRTGWDAPEGPSRSYGDPMSFFNEMMNWGLIGLYLVDMAPPADLAPLLANLEERMARRRGFIRFPEFHQFLVELYRKRPAGATVASLYPAIVTWFEERAGPARPASHGG